MIPTIYLGEGRFETATPYHRQRVDTCYGKGERVLLEEVGEARSLQSERHYFARLEELWENLPEWLAEEFASPTHLRKWALCKTGYCTKRSLVLRTNAEAIDAAALIGDLDEYIICEVIGRVVTMWIAESQSRKAMRNARFQQSKSDVLDYCEKLVASPRPAEEPT
jgi:hypothetical protein